MSKLIEARDLANKLFCEAGPDTTDDLHTLFYLLDSYISNENRDLESDQRLLNALRYAGVDNWEGWDNAIDSIEG